MAFESLSEKLQATFRKLRGRGKLSEQDVDRALREVRLALLEADVNFKVARDFTKRVRDRSVGQEVLESLTPGQQVVKIVHEELTRLMGEREQRLTFSGRPPTVMMLVGLQGSGKTTTTGKLARHLHTQGRQPVLVAADVYRPAAAEQLEQLGGQLGLPVIRPDEDEAPEALVARAVTQAEKDGNDVVLIDTAGRLHIDEDLMGELQTIQSTVSVHESLLVLDAMTGQDAVNMAESFSEHIDISGVVLTKLDGDARGGAALSVLEVTGCPVKLVGTGEKLDALEIFHPERMSSRILGMGDVLTLIEKAEQSIDQDKARKMQQRLRDDTFTLDDFLEQLEEMRNLGPIDQLLSMIPGMAKQNLDAGQIDEAELNRVAAIIQSMTYEERENPEIIKRSRRRRIAQGSGTRVQDVNRLLKQYQATREMIRQFAQGKGPGSKKMKNLKLPF